MMQQQDNDLLQQACEDNRWIESSYFAAQPARYIYTRVTRVLVLLGYNIIIRNRL
jgi:hypothetical protein